MCEDKTFYIVPIEQLRHKPPTYASSDKVWHPTNVWMPTARSFPSNLIGLKMYIKIFENGLATESQRFSLNYYILFSGACAVFDWILILLYFKYFVYSWRCESRWVADRKHKNKQTQNMFYTRNANTISILSPFDDFSFCDSGLFFSVAVTRGDLDGDAEQKWLVLLRIVMGMS